MVEGEGFEPSKHEAADLQSAGFDRSPTPPKKMVKKLCAILLLQAYYVNLIRTNFDNLRWQKTSFLH